MGLRLCLMQDCSPHLPNLGARQDVTPLASLKLAPHQHEEEWKAVDGFLESNKFVNFAPSVTRPVLIDIKETRPDSVLFSYGIVEQCTRQEKIMQFLMSGSDELERRELDLSTLSDLMGLQALQFDAEHHQHSPLVCPSGQYDGPKSLVDFVGDMARNSEITIHPDGRVLLTGNGREIKDILSVVAEFYLSKTSTASRKSSILVPHFSRLDTVEAQANTLGSLKVEDVITAPQKRCLFPIDLFTNFISTNMLLNLTSSTEKMKFKPLPKRKHGKKVIEQDLYRRNYFHACESLLSLILANQQRTAIKSSPELPELLTQFSAIIAGTGLAVLFSVFCKVACGRVPFCASKVFSTGFGLGLVWLSHGVNKLGDTVAYIGRNVGKGGLKDQEIMRSVDRSLKDVYSRAATVMAIAVLRLA
ncbi:hypothetical protein Tsubulata_025749 [Turnera subulata]|uniref:Uncharacterized protein n=1 Tax=Turnera subulata TaxID=218843 RepID=A0A9Q0FI44_9ROSI|nr:hypothetical protein Tsubulata_025749 [Turnera subulata]